MPKLTETEVRKRFARISPHITIEDHYVNNHTPMKCKCHRHNVVWLVRWDALTRGCGCRECGKEKQIQKFRLPREEIVKRLRVIDPNIRLVGKYNGALAKSKFHCRKCGHNWQALWHNLQQGHGCPKCGEQSSRDGTRMTLAEAKQRLKLLNPLIKIVDHKYINSSTGIKCLCLRCQHQWSPCWDSLQAKKGCPNCANSHHKSEEEVRQAFERLTGLKFPKANPSAVPWLHGLYLDGYCRELRSEEWPNGVAFEYQGCQHFQPSSWHGNSAAKLCVQKKRDQRKRIQCWRHGVRLITVPYNIKDLHKYIVGRLSVVQPKLRLAAVC